MKDKIVATCKRNGVDYNITNKELDSLYNEYSLSNKINLRQYVIIPKHPKMSAGKIASQACHATFMALKKDETRVQKTYDGKGKLEDEELIGINTIEEWKEKGMCVIVLECKDSNHLMQIAQYLEQWHITHHLYIDEGMTEVEPMTATALATGIIDNEHKWIFEQFKLYSETKK